MFTYITYDKLRLGTSKLIYTVGHKKSQLIFVCNFVKKAMDFNAVFTVRFNKNSSGDEIANVNFFYNIAHVEASAYAH